MYIATRFLFLFTLLPAFHLSPIVSGQNKTNFLFHSLSMAALFFSGAWTSVYLQGLFFNRTVRVYRVKEFSFPLLLGCCWNDCKMGWGGNALVIADEVASCPSKQEDAGPRQWLNSGDLGISALFNYLKAQVTYPTSFWASPHGDFLQVLANTQESNV